MIRHLATVDKVIDALGGTSEVARLVGKWPTAVSNWRIRGLMPADVVDVMQTELARSGFKAPRELWGIRKPLKQRAFRR